jgi:GIY-YIG catalytic domain
MITIYKITSPTGKIYVGQTKDYRKRLNHYRILNCRTQYRLHNSLKKYGFNNHLFEIIEEIDTSIADSREQYWIAYFKCYWKDQNKGLNLNKGGNRPNHTEETKKKLSEMFSGSKHGKAKKLYQYTLDGVFVKEWSCMKDIERKLNYKTTCLSKAAKNNSKTAYGYKWSYEPLH